MTRLLLVIIALLLAGCSSGHQAAIEAHAPAPAPEDARQLMGSEINEALIGRQHSSVTTTGYKFKETFSQDGTVSIKIEGEPEQIGRWMITEDVICVTYKKYEECNTVRTDGTSIWLVDKTKNTTNDKFSRQ